MRTLGPVALVLFAGCASPPGAAPVGDPPSGDVALPRAASAAGSALPAGASDGWAAVVGARLAAEARAITARDGAFRAALPAAGLLARFDPDGVTVGDALALRTTAWGRSDELVRVGPRTPALGACTPAVDAQERCIQRLEYADGALTEWWVGLGDGLEQGWTLAAAPPGDGPLMLDVAVDAALAIEADGDALAITDGDGRAWTVGALTAWDADGVTLAAALVVTDAGLRVVVDDAGAAYPVTVDPVYSTASATLDVETEATGSLGTAVAHVGDVDGDGYDDVLVGAHTWSAYTGRAYLFHGSPTGMETAATTTLTGESASDNFGACLAAAGDVNGDGYADVALGTYAYADYTGRAYVFHGSAAGVSATPAATLDGTASSYFGASVAGAGDVNGDGFADLVLGAHSPGTAILGSAHVFHGSAAGINPTAARVLTASSAIERFGSAVAGAGDIDADGYDDVLVGAYSYAGGGAFYVFHGGASGVSAAADTTVTGTSASHSLGVSLAPAGDVDGDGYADVIAGAMASSSRAYGLASVYRGSAAGLVTASPTTLTSPTAGTNFGSRVAGGGDVDGDGFDDVAVSASDYSSATGRVYVYTGGPAGVDTAAAATLTGDSTSSYYGLGLAIAGDTDGDGYDDPVVGAYYYGSLTGRLYEYAGAAGGVSTAARATVDGVDESWFGWAVAGTGDVDADGYDDVIVGAFDAGRAYVFHGAASGLSTAATTTLHGDAADVLFGVAVAGAGDVNADGYADVIVGDSGWSTSAGRALVFHGAATGVDPTVAATLAGTAAYSSFGRAVAGAGDVNGDGYGDVAVTSANSGYGSSVVAVFHGAATGVSTAAARRLRLDAYAVDGAGDVNGDGYDDLVLGWSSAGEAYVYLGSSAGIGASADTTLVGPVAYGRFGAAVAGAGDGDGDGFDDLIVGAPANSGSSAGAGVVPGAYVFHGSAAGVSLSATTTLTGEAAGDDFGEAVAAAGDLDGDGYADVVVGAPDYGSDAGRLYVFRGSVSGVDPAAAATVTGDAARDLLGAAVAGAGDVNGDGYPEILVGAPGWRGNTGRAYLYESERAAPPGGDTADTGTPVDTDTGTPADTAVDTDTGTPADTDTGSPADTDTGSPVDTDTGSPVDTDTGSPVDTDTGTPVDTDTGSPVDTAADTDTGSPADTDTGVDSDPPVDTAPACGCRAAEPGAAWALLPLPLLLLTRRRRA